MAAAESWPFFSVFASALKLNVSFVAMAYICLFYPYELYRKLIQLLEVVAGVTDDMRSKTCARSAEKASTVSEKHHYPTT